MTQEDKKLLLIDLGGRMAYYPMCEFTDTEDDFCTTTAALGYSLRDFIAGKIPIKPYLRPMSSMTDEEREEWYRKSNVDYDCEFKPEPTLSLDDCHLSTDWLNEHHFDYRGLIEKGLALELPEGMYK